MSRFFERRTVTGPSLDSVCFDTHGYESRGEPRPGEMRAWWTPEGDAVGLYYFAQPPDLPSAASVDELRAFYASSMASSAGELLEVSTLRIDECPASRVVIRVPQQPSGMTYVGSLTIPFLDFSFVIKVQCEEKGATGIREALLLDRRLKSGEMPSAGDGRLDIQNWDPDHESFDADFPDHPVSRARRVLDRIERSLRVDRAVRRLPAFPLPQAGRLTGRSG